LHNAKLVAMGESKLYIYIYIIERDTDKENVKRNEATVQAKSRQASQVIYTGCASD